MPIEGRRPMKRTREGQRQDKEAKEARELEKQAAAEPDSNVNWMNPTDVTVWYGNMVIHFLRLMRKAKAGQRLRALNSAVDSWQKAYKLASDSTELEELKQRLDQLQSQLDREQGIRAVR